MRNVYISAHMLDPLTRYLSCSYLKFYIAPFLLWLLVILPETIVDQDEYLGLVPLSYVATFTLFGLVVYLASNREFETLQSYGVSFRRLVVPVLAVSLALQAGMSAFAVIVSNDPSRAIAFAILTFLAVVVSSLATLKTIWDQRDPAAFRACLRGFAGQTSLLLLVWGIASLFYQFGHTH